MQNQQPNMTGSSQGFLSRTAKAHILKCIDGTFSRATGCMGRINTLHSLFETVVN